MLCQKCKKRQATVFLTQSINGVTRQIALCGECAEQTGGFPGTLDLLGGLFTGSRHTPPSTTKRCSFCGSTFARIAERGKPGCATCYEIFRDELAPTIADIHGADAHFCGRGELSCDAPDTPDPDPTVESESAELTEKRAALAEAIANEDYERAAILRDEIRALENAN